MNWVKRNLKETNSSDMKYDLFPFDNFFKMINSISKLNEKKIIRFFTKKSKNQKLENLIKNSTKKLKSQIN